MRLLFLGLVLAAAAVGSLWAGQFGWGPVVVTNEYEYKIRLVLGSPWREPITEPGLTARVPLLESIETLDKRLQYMDARPVELLIGDETLLVDYYAVWRIIDPLVFRRSYPGGMGDAEKAIQRRLKSLVGATVGRLPLEQLLSRANVLEQLDTEVSAKLAEKGVRVVDVRINRTELPREAEPAAYQQMREQRRAVSREHRARGERAAREIRAKADHEARTILARASANAEVTRGEGDAAAAAIYAAAYEKDTEFYAFLRTLEAYRATVGERTTLVLAPGNEFFRFLSPEKESPPRGNARSIPEPGVSSAPALESTPPP